MLLRQRLRAMTNYAGYRQTIIWYRPTLSNGLNSCWRERLSGSCCFWCRSLCCSNAAAGLGVLRTLLFTCHSAAWETSCVAASSIRSSAGVSQRQTLFPPRRDVAVFLREFWCRSPHLPRVEGREEAQILKKLATERAKKQSEPLRRVLRARMHQ